MSENITLEQLLAVMKPDEPVNIGVEINQNVSEAFFIGKVETFPESFYEKYKDYIAISMNTPATFDPGFNMEEDVRQKFKEIYDSDKDLHITLAIPENYPYYKYNLKNLLDTINDNEKVSILDPTDSYNFEVDEGLRKDIPEGTFNQIENRKVIFVEKPVFMDENEESSLAIYLEERKKQ